MIVGKDDCRNSAQDDCDSENLSRMNENRVQCSNGNEMMSFYPSTCVEQENCETFAVRIEVWNRFDI